MGQLIALRLSGGPVGQSTSSPSSSAPGELSSTASSPSVVSKGRGDSPALMSSGLACPYLNHQGQLYCAAYSRGYSSLCCRWDQVPHSSDLRDNSPREGPADPGSP